MAADGEVKVNIKVTADNKGGRETEQTLDKVEKKANRSLKSIVGGFADAKRAAGLFQKAVGALANFGFVTAGFNALLGLLDKFGESTRKAQEEAIKLAEAEKDAADKERVEKLAEAYRKLSGDIADAAKARERANELEDMERSAADKLEDDTAELKMREEIAALDENDPLYDKKKQKISSAYETEKLRRSVARQRRDADISEKRTWDEREATIGEATEKEVALIDEKAELDRIKREAKAARAASVSENAFDVQNALEGFRQNLKSILTLDYRRFDNDRTEKGDEYRAKKAQEAEELEKRAAEKEKEIAEKQKEIEDLNKTAEHLKKKAVIQGNISVNAGVAAESADVSAATTNKAAEKALSDEAAKLADARRAKELLTQQKADVKASIKAEEDRKAAAGRAVYEAQGNFDLARANGAGRSQQTAAFNALQEAKTAAQNVDHAADSAINALKKTLDSIETRLKAASRYLESKDKQTKSFMAETPAGS